MRDLLPILVDLTEARDELVQERTRRQHSRDDELVLVARIDMLNTALAAVHHAAAPSDEIRKALKI
jgi:hypothetical protein